MPYKDKESKIARQKERRQGLQGASLGITKEAGASPGIKTLDTPADIKAAITVLTGRWHPVDQWTPAEIVAHQARIRAAWSCSGDWNAAYHALAPAMGWGRR